MAKSCASPFAVTSHDTFFIAAIIATKPGVIIPDRAASCESSLFGALRVMTTTDAKLRVSSMWTDVGMDLGPRLPGCALRGSGLVLS